MKLLGLTLALVGIYSTESLDIVPVQGGLEGTGITTRYWDCCKPSCAWIENSQTQSPIRSCTADGSTTISSSAQSGCSSYGNSFTCTDQQPYVVNNFLAIGFVAASFVGGADVAKCCACFLLSFQGQLEGKNMVVQITNTGSDLDQNQFDIAIPGGGVGLANTGCTAQWNAPENGWGDRYGGVSTLEECNQLPTDLQPGCRFRFQWMNGVSNPNVTFSEIECPTQLVAITTCRRW